MSAYFNEKDEMPSWLEWVLLPLVLVLSLMYLVVGVLDVLTRGSK